MATKAKVSKDVGGTSIPSVQRNYELMLVISAALTEERLNATVGGITQFIMGLEGTVAESRLLGKRRLAYPIKHQSEGHYVMVHFRAKSAVGPQLEARLNILEEVLRYLLVNQD
ncbi:MAG: 30S ribosomal protein S6 [Dehalococcoidia bacterium]|nr:30S ribosomal protein S6 [Dehalococcoidia bacterium]